MNYQDFLENKTFVLASQGFDVDVSELNPHLFDYQRDIVRWALAKGRAAVFTDCGTGKSLIELEFGHQVHCHTGYDVLIVAPLSVVDQTRREGEKFGISVNVCASQDDVKPGLEERLGRPGEAPFTLTVSMGWSPFDPQEGKEAFLTAMDEKMYEKKRKYHKSQNAR